MEEPKYLNEYINQILFDSGSLNVHHLNSIRIGLSAYFRRIRYVDVDADLNNNLLEFTIKFRWWSYFFLPKRKFLKRIRNMISKALPKPAQIVDEKDGQAIVEYVDYDINIGYFSIRNRVIWLDNEEIRSK